MSNKAKARAASPPIYAPRRSMTEGDAEDRKPIKREFAARVSSGFVPEDVIELSSDEEDRVSSKPCACGRRAREIDGLYAWIGQL